MGSVSLIRTAANDPQYAARVILADQNQDGEINVADVLLLQRRLLSGERYPPQAALEPVAPGTAGGMERQTSFAALIDYLIHPAHAVPGDPGQLLYVHVDHLGTPVAMTDEQGVKVWSAVYDPFGKATPNEDPDGNGQAVTLNVRFAGQYYDQERGLHYNYFRYYDPGTGRYLTSDPVGLRGGLNTYRYALSNPVKYFDLDGLAVRFICRVLDGPLGLTGKKHCFVYVTCPEEGWERVLSLFSDGFPYSAGRKASATPGLPGHPDDPFSPNNTDDFPVPNPQCSSGECEYEKEVIERFLNFPSGPVPYFPLGPNSNGFADYLVNGAGGGVSGAPGVGVSWQ